jgi:acetyl-CoA/propionyl-CoA carboxylase carboxyl transferase subunit
VSDEEVTETEEEKEEEHQSNQDRQEPTGDREDNGKPMNPETPEETLKRLKHESRIGGGEDKIQKQHDKGKKTARERIDYLFDAGTFQEIDPLVQGRNVDDPMSEGATVPGDGVVCGFGKINGRKIACYSQDFTVTGGTLSEENSRKICKTMDLAARYGVPIIGINDSGGARIQQGVRSLSGYAEIFHRNTQYSGEIPQISLIMGPCAGGAVYSPAICDLVVMVEDTSFMYVTGPDVVETVTGEKLSHTDLGGAKVHRSESGVAHMVGENDQRALDLAVKALSYLPNNHDEVPDQRDERLPETSESLQELVPDDKSRPYEVKRVIKAIVDGSSFLELQPDFARNLVTGFARLGGHSVGVVANQPKYNAGTLDIKASYKGARFVRLCDAFNIPIITLEDVPGFLPGKEQEQEGIIRHGAKLLYAYSEATVPLLTLITRKSYGGAYCVMASKQLGADFNFAWPIAEIAVMGPESAVSVLHGDEIAEADNPQEVQQQKLEELRERFGNPWEAARMGYLDDVILPGETRSRLQEALEVALEGRQYRDDTVDHGNIPL